MKFYTKLIIAVVAIGFGFWAVGKSVALYCDYLWFDELGYTGVYMTELLTKSVVGVGVFLLVAGWLGGNAWLAGRLAPGQRIDLTEAHPWLTPRHVRWLIRAGGAALIFIIALAWGRGTAGDWLTFQKFAHRTAFGWTDPILGYDAGFYVFVLPILAKVQVLVVWLSLLGLVAATAAYFAGGAISTQYIRLTRRSLYHLSALGMLLFVGIAFGHWLKRPAMLFTGSSGDTVYGAGYVDVNVHMPMRWVMVLVSLVAGGLVMSAAYVRRRWLTYAGLGTLVGGHIILVMIVPHVVQSLVVKPNELDLEEPYLAHNIAATRFGFGFGKGQDGAAGGREVKSVSYDAKKKLTYEDVTSAEGTIRNVRLWDFRVLQDIYNELQGLRTYYWFNQPDVDRYHLNGDYRQVSIGVRELVHRRLQQKSRTWVNQHIIYTHGYGPVMNPVNKVRDNGSPVFWMKDMPPKTDVPIDVPPAGVYFGEYTRDYVLVKTGDPDVEKEFHYPVEIEGAKENEYTRYDGKAGVSVGGWFRRLLFAYYFGDKNILFVDSLTDESRVLWRRDIRSRVMTLARFLRFERRRSHLVSGDQPRGRPMFDTGTLPSAPNLDPYPVLLKGRVVWVLDAYTATSRFPYSAPVGHTSPAFRARDRGLNYIRNSVKVAIDAYDGTVTLYVAEPEDPIIRTLEKVFPELFTSIEKMTPELKRHLRYPLNLLDIQADRYMLYHVTNPKVLYNRTDLWQRPQETYHGASRPIEMVSYYVIMTLPGEQEPEYIVMLPFTPEGKNNMIGWMVGRCDDEHYGELLAYQFPKGSKITGPSQIESMIDKDPMISRKITLWSQRGSRVLRGNLLVLPVAGGLLYVEPLYLDSENTKFPQLAGVIVSDGEKVALAESQKAPDDDPLDLALRMVFGKAPIETPPDERPEDGPPAGTVPDLAATVQSAREKMSEAQEALDNGNLAEYQRLVEEAAREIERAAELLKGEAPPE